MVVYDCRRQPRGADQDTTLESDPLAEKYGKIAGKGKTDHLC
jgi:hypothetical protein